jgi:hypothetical protein
MDFDKTMPLRPGKPAAPKEESKGEAAIEPTLAALGYRRDLIAPKLDPRRYAEFVRLAQGFRAPDIPSAVALKRTTSVDSAAT